MADANQKILVLFAHPRYENSRVQGALIREIKSLPNVHIHDLYEEYPEFNINIKREQKLLLRHDIIVWMHPFYWYSAPPIMKQWIDLVLEHGWAYGKNGKELMGKKIFNCVSSGGPRESYQAEGFHGFTVHEFLRPFQRTATLCNMNYLPPFFVHGSHKISDKDLKQHALNYKQVITKLSNNEFNVDELMELEYLNDWN
jgi:glutathione-regulated potassium-efflux system ancillary protein KefG